uniref:HMA domain-containing protein n=1 Tax=Kalanchoe fedtschenkoi TaxID=63787 RepID=A0A7N0T2S5_KALFE
MASAISSWSFGLGFHRPRDSPSSSFVAVPSRVAKCGDLVAGGKKNLRAADFGRRLIVKAVEEKTLAREEAGAGSESDTPDPVSPSDALTMWFQAEGAMKETAIPTVTKALEEIEGVANLKVQVLEGIASVELVKQTTIQETGVAADLVEKIQGSGFKLQTLNLSFQDEVAVETA